MKAWSGLAIFGILLGASAPVHATTYFAQAKCGGSGTYDIETNRSADEGCALQPKIVRTLSKRAPRRIPAACTRTRMATT